MANLEELRFRKSVQQASKAQLDAILAALGGEWPGFNDSEAVLTVVRGKHVFADHHLDLKDVQSVPELVERLGVNLDHIDPNLLEYARVADKQFHRTLDEDMRAAKAEHEASPEYQEFLAEQRKRFGPDAL